MDKFKTLLPTLLTSTIMVCSLPAQAEGLYIGAGAYRADSDLGADTTPAGFIGYTLIDTNFLMVSVEAGYYDLGNTSNKNKKLEASAITAGGVLSLPLGPIFELYAKGGVAFMDAKTESQGQNDKQNDGKAYYGVGASLDILDTIDIYAEYVIFDTSFNAEVAGVGIKLSF